MRVYSQHLSFFRGSRSLFRRGQHWKLRMEVILFRRLKTWRNFKKGRLSSIYEKWKLQKKIELFLEEIEIRD